MEHFNFKDLMVFGMFILAADIYVFDLSLTLHRKTTPELCPSDEVAFSKLS